MHYEEIETFALALLTIVNPVGGAAIVAGMTREHAASELASVARSTSVAAAIILLLAAWLGEPLLALFSISVPMFEVVGGRATARPRRRLPVRWRGR